MVIELINTGPVPELTNRTAAKSFVVPTTVGRKELACVNFKSGFPGGVVIPVPSSHVSV
jgi:hypothetical protein